MKTVAIINVKKLSDKQATFRGSIENYENDADYERKPALKYYDINDVVIGVYGVELSENQLGRIAEVAKGLGSVDIVDLKYSVANIVAEALPAKMKLNL